MRYLFSGDYYAIQDSQMNQLIQGNTYKLKKAEKTAIEEASSYLVQRWDMSKEFTDTPAYNYSKSYFAGDRVTIDFDGYSNTSIYTTGSTVLYSNVGYVCTTAPTASGPFNAANWTAVGDKWSIYYVSYPFPEFNVNNFYSTGDVVFYKGKTWSCVSQTKVLNTQQIYQYPTYADVPLQNVFPDSSLNSQQIYWATSGITYSVPAGTLPTDTNYFTEGDNRSQQLIVYCVDITLYHLHKAIAPQNIPELRVKAYDDAISWFKKAYRGDVTINVPQKQPDQGMMIRWGGPTKGDNSY